MPSTTDLLDALAVNPALPPALAWRLLGRCASRPDLAPSLVEAIIATGDRWSLHLLALNRSIPEAVRRWLSAHPDGAVRAALVAGGVPGDLRERLLADPDPEVRAGLARVGHPRLARDPDPAVRAEPATWWVTAPEDVRRLLLTDPVDAVRAAACATYYARLPHPVPPADLVPALLDDPITRAGAVPHATLTPDLAARLAGDPSWEVRAELAKHPELPAALRDALAEDPSPMVRLGIFGRADTPHAARSRIHADLHTDALWEDDLLATAARIILRTLRPDWVTADPLPYVDSPFACFRAAAAEGRDLPPAVVARLLDDDHDDVRVAMFRNAPGAVGLDVAERIDRDFRAAKRTRWRPADDVDFPLDHLRRLAADPDPRMRCLAAGRDPDLAGMLAAAGNPEVPADVMASLIG